MARKHSAGILLYRRETQSDETKWLLLLVRPGGPYYAGRDTHDYGVPKGLFKPESETPVSCARREFREETGAEPPPAEDLRSLGQFDTGTKVIYVFVAEGNFDCSTLVSNTFQMMWPKRGGTLQTFPEVEKAEWVDIDDIEAMLHKSQAAIGAAMREFVKNC